MDERKLIKNNDTEEIKKLIYKGAISIDDPVDQYSKHTLLHDAVVMNREELFNFLLYQGANPMVRDINGYTPLLKAAALGKLSMAKKMIEEGGVDPRHRDPYGNKPSDKAKLYNRYELTKYLLEMEEKANRGDLKLKNWKDPNLFKRSGRFRTIFDY
jgi:ankyrin repeat protein